MFFSELGKEDVHCWFAAVKTLQVVQAFANGHKGLFQWQLESLVVEFFRNIEDLFAGRFCGFTHFYEVVKALVGQLDLVLCFEALRGIIAYQLGKVVGQTLSAGQGGTFRQRFKFCGEAGFYTFVFFVMGYSCALV